MPSSLFRMSCAVGLALSMSGPNPAWAFNQLSPTASPVSANTSQAPAGCQTWSEQLGTPSAAPAPCLQTLQARARERTKVEDKTLNQVETRESVVETFGGRKGQQSHAVFQVQDNWAVRWESFSDSFVLFLHDEQSAVPTTKQIATMYDAGKGQFEGKTGGKYYLETVANGAWSIEVVQKVNESSYEYDLTVGYTVKNPFVFPISMNLRLAENEEVTLNISPGQEKLLTQNLLLTDFDTKQSDAELLAEIEPVSVLEVLNQSPQAIAERQRIKDQAKRKAESERIEAEQIAEEERNRGNAELETFAQTTNETNAKRERDKSIHNETLERIAREDERRRNLALKASGIAVLAATIGGSVALLTVGGIGYPDAKKKLDDHDARHANNPDPKFTVKTLRGEYVREKQRYRGMLVGGAILAVAGLVVPTTLFILSGKSNRPSSQKIDSQRAKLIPTFDDSHVGLSLFGNF